MAAIVILGVRDDPAGLTQRKARVSAGRVGAADAVAVGCSRCRRRRRYLTEALRIPPNSA